MTSIRAAGTLDLTVHRRDPKVRPDVRVPVGQQGRRARVIVAVAAEATGHLGRTVCGRRLELDELWVDYEPESCDVLCTRCFTDGSGAA